MPGPQDVQDFHYSVFGLQLRSRFVLPELEPGSTQLPGAVEIVPGVVPIPDGDGDRRHWLSRLGDSAILSVADVGRFHIQHGNRIVVDANPAAAAGNVRLFLLGSAMGALLHQRAMLPLHANAIAIDGRAIVFMGHSGAGKSTLAAAFQDRGYRILSDDVCVAAPRGEGFDALPGIPRLRLWRDAVERSGRDPAHYERAFDTLDKYTVNTALASRAGTLPLGAIFLLASHDGDAPAAIHRLAGTSALQALIENTYRGSFVAITGNPRTHFDACLALSRGVPVFQLSRPWDPARIGESLATIEAALRILLPAPLTASTH